MKKLNGNVIFAKTPLTATVETTLMRIDPLYKKRIWRKRKYLVHNNLEAKLGDFVVIAECRPISKMKSWIIVEIIGKKDRNVAAIPRDDKNVIANEVKQSRPKRTVKRSVKK